MGGQGKRMCGKFDDPAMVRQALGEGSSYKSIASRNNQIHAVENPDLCSSEFHWSGPPAVAISQAALR
jgi:hypothetical protein